jgi:hypothetical protein
MHLQSFGNPPQDADEKRGFRRGNLPSVPMLGNSSRIISWNSGFATYRRCAPFSAYCRQCSK